MVNSIISFILAFLLFFHDGKAVITTKGRRFVVNEGDSIELPCNIDDIGVLIIRST